MTVIAMRDQNRLRAISLEAMALNISNDDDHPNKMPFSGVLVRLDEPSDVAPGGAHGRRIIVTAEAARKALPTLLGMAVDFTPSFDGHDAQAKIGIITSADIVGNAIVISGFVYAADFPEIASAIKAQKSVLGFSFEAQRLTVSDPCADILTITGLAFTGAAILRKDKAAFTSTSLAASAATTRITTMFPQFDNDSRKPLRFIPFAIANPEGLLRTTECLGFAVPKQLTALAASGVPSLGNHGFKIDLYELDNQLKTVDWKTHQKIEYKIRLQRQGLL